MTANNLTVHPRPLQRGITLLENMVALLVISVGLLGFAGMQAFTLHSSASSTHRQLAMQLAQDMADRIRANPAAYFDVSDKVNHYHGIAPDAAPATPTNDCRTAHCTAQELAAFDIYEWQLANHALPGDHDVAGGYVFSQNLTDIVDNTPLMLSPDKNMPQRQRFTIAVRWDGDGTGSKLDEASPADCTKALADHMKCYAMVIDL